MKLKAQSPKGLSAENLAAVLITPKKILYKIANSQNERAQKI
jgi:hypothetical protein